MRAVAVTHGSVHRSRPRRGGTVSVYQLTLTAVVMLTIVLSAVTGVRLLHSGRAVLQSPRADESAAVAGLSDDTTVAGVQINKPSTVPAGNAAGSALAFGLVLLAGTTISLGLVVVNKRR